MFVALDMILTVSSQRPIGYVRGDARAFNVRRSCEFAPSPSPGCFPRNGLGRRWFGRALQASWRRRSTRTDLEITPDLVHPEWRENGHAGFVLEGELELHFKDQVVQYGPGDGFVIPPGPADKHIPRALSSRTVLLLFEQGN